EYIPATVQVIVNKRLKYACKACESTMKSIRREKSKPIVDEMQAWLTTNVNRVPKKMPIGEAIQYAIKQWPHLVNYLEDGRLEIDNNRSERAVKPFVIGRKNWLFSGNHHGAIAGANIFSLIETAKIHGLNPHYYLRHIFTYLPQAQTLEQWEALLPWNCKGGVG
uniref:IS66 family transposase n=1 Tax=Fulvivirga sp. TaxID=1931237 RepID=UPI00404A83B1